MHSSTVLAILAFTAAGFAAPVAQDAYAPAAYTPEAYTTTTAEAYPTPTPYESPKEYTTPSAYETPKEYATPTAYDTPKETPTPYETPKEYATPTAYETPKEYATPAPAYETPKEYKPTPPVYTPEPKPYHEKKPEKSEEPANQCSENQEAACCNSDDGATGSLLGAQCLLSVLGGSCSGSVQCCDVDGDGELISLNLCIPIQL